MLRNNRPPLVSLPIVLLVVSSACHPQVQTVKVATATWNGTFADAITCLGGQMDCAQDVCGPAGDGCGAINWCGLAGIYCPGSTPDVSGVCGSKTFNICDPDPNAPACVPK